MKKSDIIIIGGGIVGLATAYQLSQAYPQLSLIILEKETEVAQHQTGHNSGVLHTGVYYKPGSLKAKNCREGKRRMEEFCTENEIPYEICGKVIVATSEAELPALERILERGSANGVVCELIPRERLLELEPHVNGIQAIHVPEAGITDYTAVCRRLAEIVQQEEHRTLRLGTKVTGLRTGSSIVVETTTGAFEGDYLINCAGLYSDKVTEMTMPPQHKIIPFRGEYYEVNSNAQHLCNNLIYPVPDPSFPFLGVHFTRMIQGGLECGPNAVLAFAREGYTRTTVNWQELAESLSYPGFLKLAAKYWKTGAGELWRSFSKAAFTKALQRLIPAIQAADLEAASAGIRAQAVTPDGKPVDDFLIQQEGRVVHVGNAPSPGATSSLNIGSYILDQLAPMIGKSKTA
ncbi:MAG: L-2-hydroxyglutarate oxidase [SAR324 cluster bacterium]|nr:L-2-hydroxyglutarate oxidase [SAR324 cluster bacterium]MDP7629809.1 L-2-hydroxyglutarate oxidase [SAR324 cluster bacterium]